MYKFVHGYTRPTAIGGLVRVDVVTARHLLWALTYVLAGAAPPKPRSQPVHSGCRTYVDGDGALARRTIAQVEFKFARHKHLREVRSLT